MDSAITFAATDFRRFLASGEVKSSFSPKSFLPLLSRASGYSCKSSLATFSIAIIAQCCIGRHRLAPPLSSSRSPFFAQATTSPVFGFTISQNLSPSFTFNTNDLALSVAVVLSSSSIFASFEFTSPFVVANKTDGHHSFARSNSFLESTCRFETTHGSKSSFVVFVTSKTFLAYLFSSSPETLTNKKTLSESSGFDFTLRTCFGGTPKSSSSSSSSSFSRAPPPVSPPIILLLLAKISRS